MGQTNEKAIQKKPMDIPKFIDIGGPDNDPTNPFNQSDPFFFFATEIVMKILRYLNEKELMTLVCVSKRWRAYAYDPWNTFEAMIKKPWTIDDSKILGLVFSQKSSSKWNFKSCEKITNFAIKSLVDYSNQITSIDLYGCKKIGDNALFFIAGSKHAATLHSLSLSWLPLVTHIGMLAISKNCTSLKHLSLFGTKITNFASFFPNLTQLESLDVGNTLNIMHDTYELIAKYCTNLTKLKCRTKEVEKIGVVFKSLNTKLTHLEIPTARLTEQILEDLVTYCPNIEHINLGCLYINFPELWSERRYEANRPLSKKIAYAISKYSALKSLNLQEDFFIDNEDVELILQSCLQLEHLSISTHNSLFVTNLLMKYCSPNYLKHIHITGSVVDKEKRDMLREFFTDAVFEF